MKEEYIKYNLSSIRDWIKKSIDMKINSEFLKVMLKNDNNIIKSITVEEILSNLCYYKVGNLNYQDEKLLEDLPNYINNEIKIYVKGLGYEGKDSYFFKFL